MPVSLLERQRTLFWVAFIQQNIFHGECDCMGICFHQQPTQLESMELEVLCPQCKQQFTDTNPPRLMTICGHTYCENCLTSWATQEELTGKLKIVCPEDKSEAIFENVQHLPKNLALMGVLQSRKNNTSSRSINSIKDQSFNLAKINNSEREDEVADSLLNGMEQKQVNQEKKQIHQQQIPPPLSLRKSDNEPQMCLLHNKLIELVCLDDHHRLCSKCALFGQHKGHDVVSFEQIEQGNRKIYDGLLIIFDQKELLLDDITSKSKKERLRQRLSAKSQCIRKELAQRFKKIHQQLNRAQKSAYYQLEQLTESIQKKMRRYLILDDKIISQYESWTLEAEKKVNFYQTSTHEGLLDFYLSGATLIDSGKDIIKQLKQQERQSNNQANRIIDEIGISFNDSHLIGCINKIVDIYQNQKEWEKKADFQKQNSKIFANCQFYEDIKKGLKTETHEDDQSLLELVDQFQTRSHNRSITSTILNESMVKLDNLKPTPAKMTKSSINGTPSKLPTRKKLSSVLMKQQKRQEKKEEKKEGGLTKQAIKKKMKSIKLPQKYEKILEGVLCDALDTVDFTNAELGDAICFQICDMLKNNVRAKTLKLIRNKITDEGFTKFLPFLTGISTLNLSQNLLTENCLNMIADYRQNLPNLRALILSQNKIAERKCKPLLQRLRKMDLTVSI